MGRRNEDDERYKRWLDEISQSQTTDINSFIDKIKLLEEKVDYVYNAFPPPSRKNNEKYSPKKEAKFLIDKVHLLVEKINRFSNSLSPENPAHSGQNEERASSNKVFKILSDKLTTLEEKLTEFSRLKMLAGHPDKGYPKNEAAQIVKKLRAMEEKIDHFYKIIPNSAPANYVNKKNDASADIMEQMRQLADETDFYSSNAIPTSSSGIVQTEPGRFWKRKAMPRKPSFTGKIIVRKKPRIKKGFITWPSEDELPELWNERNSYITNWGGRQPNIEPDHLLSEPSEFYLNSSFPRRSQTMGLCFKESEACGKAIVKNRNLKK